MARCEPIGVFLFHLVAMWREKYRFFSRCVSLAQKLVFSSPQLYADFPDSVCQLLGIPTWAYLDNRADAIKVSAGTKMS